MEEIVISYIYPLYQFATQMAFISSKIVQEVENIFRATLTPQTVAAGERDLALLRKQPYFQLSLATFLSRSNNHHHRIFAALELQKKMTLRDVQTVHIIKDIYLHDIDRIADILKEVIVDPQNCQWAGEFMRVNFEQMGVLESVRFIRLLFRWLSDQQAREFVCQHFQALLTSLGILFEIMAQSEEALYMLMVTLTLFYQLVLEMKNRLSLERIQQQWTGIEGQCKFYRTNRLDLLTVAISKVVMSQDSQLHLEQGLADLVVSLLSYQWTQNDLRLEYETQSLKFILAHSNLLADSTNILHIIAAFNSVGQTRNQTILSQSSYRRLTEISNKVEEDLLGKQEHRVRELLCGVIQQIFDHHYQLVAQHYRSIINTPKPLFLFLLPAVNYYSSTCNRSIRDWAHDHIESAFNYIGSLLGSLKCGSGFDQQLRNESVGCIEFLVRFKLLVPLKMMPRIVFLLQDISGYDSKMSSLCYLFMDQVWEELVHLEFTQLAECILKHVAQLNANEWDHCLEHYSGFLSLAQYLQEHYQFYTHLIITDDLVVQSIRAHTIMIDLLQQTPRDHLNIELLSKLINFTSYLLLGIAPGSYEPFHQTLNVKYLTDLILQHQLLWWESSCIFAFDCVVGARRLVLGSLSHTLSEKNHRPNPTEFEEKVLEQVERFRKRGETRCA